MPTIKEIAKLAGVGVGTVSRVLNGGRNVSRETMEKVLEISEKMKYRPNKTARNLVTGNYSQPTIGVVFTVAVHPFFYEILKGIYYGLKKSHYNLLIFDMSEDRSAVFNRIPFENLAGTLIVSTKMNADEKRLMKSNGVPYIYLDFFEKGENSIYLDNFTGGKTAASYLLSKGAGKIAFVGENTKSQQFEKRYAGFMSRLSENGLELVCRRLIEVEEDMSYDAYEKESYILTMKMLQEQDIDGIFYYCDEFAYGGLSAIRELGSHVSIIGYDDILPSRYLGLTTVKQPAFQLGFEGAKKIMELATSGENAVIEECILPELIVRGT